jgi:hypothetical protein
MDNKTRPLKVYNVVNLNNVRSEEEYTTKNEAKNNSQWGKFFDVIKLLHITETYQHPTSKDPPIYRPNNNHCYYVDMPQNPTLIE